MFPVGRGELVYGAVCLTRSTPFEAEEVEFLSLIAGPVHGAVTNDLMQRYAAREIKLTEGEILCLQHASFGMTSEEIAAATGYQQNTVNGYIKAATAKLGCNNRAHAIAELIRRGLVI